MKKFQVLEKLGVGTYSTVYKVKRLSDGLNYAMKKVRLPKLSKKGIMIMEGGSKERDNIDWMKKYNKSTMQPIVKKYNLKVYGTFPSITIIKSQHHLC